MKINTVSIFSEHIQTLRDAEGSMRDDVLLFFAFPLLVSIIAFALPLCLEKDFYSLSITFFGIFVALLLNIQVAIFSIFQRKWTTPSDSIIKLAQEDVLRKRKKLLRELNINSSYLITLSCLCLGLYLLFFLLDIRSHYITSVSVFLYGHFLLTLLMIVRRTYALFLGEYDLPEGES